MAKASTKKKTNKPASKKNSAKTKRPQQKSKPVAKKAKKTTSKKATASKKKTAARKPVIKKAVKKAAKKAFKKAAVKKTVSKKAAPVKKVDIKKKSVKEIAKKTLVTKNTQSTKNIKQGNPVAGKKTKPEIKASKPSKSNSVQDLQKGKKDRNAFDEKTEQKAQRILKELEERMDLSKIKPRISATTLPKPKPAPPVIKLPEPTNTSKEKFQMEFELRSSRSILFYYLSDSSGLAGWFADDVYEKDGRFTFTWEGSEQVAKRMAVQDNTLIRFQWETETDGTYFQFEIKEDDITGDIALIITDWANPGERDSNSKLWESQVLNLRQLIGS